MREGNVLFIESPRPTPHTGCLRTLRFHQSLPGRKAGSEDVRGSRETTVVRRGVPVRWRGDTAVRFPEGT